MVNRFRAERRSDKGYRSHTPRGNAAEDAPASSWSCRALKAPATPERGGMNSHAERGNYKKSNATVKKPTENGCQTLVQSGGLRLLPRRLGMTLVHNLRVSTHMG